MQRCVNSPTGSSASCTAVSRMRLPTTKPPCGPTTTAPELDTENLGCLFRWLIRQVAGDTDVVIMLRSDSSGPAGYRFPREVIAFAARWHLRYRLSYRDRRATRRSRASPLPPDRYNSADTVLRRSVQAVAGRAVVQPADRLRRLPTFRGPTRQPDAGRLGAEHRLDPPSRSTGSGPPCSTRQLIQITR